MEALNDNDSDNLVEIGLCVIEDAVFLPTSSKKKRKQGKEYLQINSSKENIDKNDSQICVHYDGMETAVIEGSLDEVIDMMGFGKFQVR